MDSEIEQRLIEAVSKHYVNPACVKPGTWVMALARAAFRVGVEAAAEVAARNEACHVCGCELLPPEEKPYCDRNGCDENEDPNANEVDIDHGGFVATSELIRALLGEGQPGEASYGPGRCEVCGWGLAASIGGGCIPGNCSYRPVHPAERRRLSERRAWLAAQRPKPGHGEGR